MPKDEEKSHHYNNKHALFHIIKKSTIIYNKWEVYYKRGSIKAAPLNSMSIILACLRAIPK